MSQGIQLHVWGDLACFTRPEMKVERVSYDVITPSAARGILEAIYWKPEIRWVIERLHVLKPVRFTSLRRNEVASKVPVGTVRSAMRGKTDALHLVVDDDRQQRAATVLRDVGYVIEARFEIVAGENNPGKHLDQFNRRARAGQCFHRPYLGCREFPADFALVEEPGHPMPRPADDAPRDRDLGFMLHDIAYAPAEQGKRATYDTIDANRGDKLVATPRFFRAYVNGEGVIDVARCLKEGGTAQ